MGVVVVWERPGVEVRGQMVRRGEEGRSSHGQTGEEVQHDHLRGTAGDEQHGRDGRCCKRNGVRGYECDALSEDTFQEIMQTHVVLKIHLTT